MNIDDFALRDVYVFDHQWLVDLHNDPVVLWNVTDPSPITMASHRKWWNDLSPEKDVRKIFVCGHDIPHERIGFCKFIAIDRSNHNCLLGADIVKEYRGKGLAKPMWTLMLDYAFGELGLHRVGLTVAVYNEIGQKVYRGLGFREEGRLVQSLYRDGEYHDQFYMYLLKEDWR